MLELNGNAGTRGRGSCERDARAGRVLRSAAASTLSDEEAGATAELFKALGDPARVRIVNLLATERRAGLRVRSDRAARAAQPTVSHHLKKLVDAGLLEREQRGKWAYLLVEARRRREARGRR